MKMRLVVNPKPVRIYLAKSSYFGGKRSEVMLRSLRLYCNIENH